MTNVRKKISELTALTSASLDTTVVGVDNGTTYKIELDTLADAVTSRVNILDRSRLSALETFTSSVDNTSLNSFTQSFSSSQSTLNNAFINAINGRVQTSSFNSYTASISTGSLVNRLNVIESETSSFLRNLNGAISSSSQLTSSYDTRYVLSGSITQTTWDNIASKPSGIVSSSVQVLGGSGVISGSSAPAGTISGSSQLTSSYDERYTLSGSLKSGIISGSSQLSGTTIPNLSGSFTGSYTGSFTGSFNGNITGVAGYSSTIATVTTGTTTDTTLYPMFSLTPSPNSYITPTTHPSGSFYYNGVTRQVVAEAFSGSILATNGVISGSSQITGIVNLTNLSATSQISASVFVGGFGVSEAKNTVISSKPMTFWPNTTFESVRFTTSGGVIIGKNGETNDFGNKLDVSGSVRFIGNTTITGSVIVTQGITGSIAATNGVISGSSQLTSSYDGRYTQTGSFNTLSSSVDSRLDTLEASIITGSVNYTQVLGDRRTGITTTGVSIISGSITTTGNPVQIMVTGDANPVNVTSWARLQLYRNETAIGNIVQVENSSNLNVPYCLNVIDNPSAGTYSYSMRTVSGITGLFDFGESTGPTLTAVELKTNTNLPSTNNTFTGTNTFNDVVTIGASSGDEGGEMHFALAQTNTTLNGTVNIDVWRNRLRLWEGGGNARGVFVDLSKAPDGVGGELLWKASGLVNTGVDVTLGNLKARLASSGNYSLQLSTVSGTYSVYGSSVYSYNGIGGITLSSPLTITTTPTYISAGYNFLVAGSTDTWNIVDTSSGISWRITMIIGPSFINNMISIERLV
jgi:hypothetical protein